MSIIHFIIGNGEVVQVEVEVAKCSKIIKDFLVFSSMCGYYGGSVKLPTSSLCLTKDVTETIFKWATYHKNELSTMDINTELSEWDKKFLDKLLKKGTFYRLLDVAQKLQVNVLLDTYAKFMKITMAKKYKDTTIAVIRKSFEIHVQNLEVDEKFKKKMKNYEEEEELSEEEVSSFDESDEESSMNQSVDEESDEEQLSDEDMPLSEMPQITLESDDNKRFTVDVAIANHMGIIRTMLQRRDLKELGIITLPNVDGRILEKIIEWVTHRKDDPPFEGSVFDIDPAAAVSEWDNNFVGMNQDSMFNIMEAAYNLDIPPLTDVFCKYLAPRMQKQSLEQIMKSYNFKPRQKTEQSSLVRIIPTSECRVRDIRRRKQTKSVHQDAVPGCSMHCNQRI